MTRVLVVLLALGTSVVAQARPKVVVLKSSELSSYRAAAAAFCAELGEVAEHLIVDEVEDLNQSRTLKRLAEIAPDLVFALGPQAAVGARRVLGKTPVVFAMVPYFEKYELDAPNVTGVGLTSDLALELSLIKAAMPDVRKVGVVYDSRYSQKFVDDAVALASPKGLTVLPVDIDGLGKLERSLRTSRGRFDALVWVSDRTVATAAVVSRLIEWSLEEKLPSIAFGPAQVKEGAFLALSPTPTAMGQQAGRVARRIVEERVDPGALAVMAPDGSELYVNLTVAEALPDGEKWLSELLSFAARQSLSVRPVEGELKALSK